MGDRGVSPPNREMLSLDSAKRLPRYARSDKEGLAITGRKVQDDTRFSIEEQELPAVSRRS